MEPITLSRERFDIAVVGQEVLMSFFEFAFSALVYGTFLPLFIITTWTTIKRGPISGSTRNMLVVSTLAFILVTVYLICQITYHVRAIRTLPLVADPDWEPSATIDMIQITETWPRSLLPLMTDTVTIWRGWILFPEQPWALLLSGVLCFVAFVSAMIQAAVQYFPVSLLLSPPKALGRLIKLFSTANKGLGSLALILSFATNVIATSSIAYGLWRYKKFAGRHLGRERRRFRAHEILGLLIVSGLVYCTFQAANVGLNYMPITGEDFFHDKIFDTQSAFTGFYTIFSAMYPTLVMFLVRQHSTSFKETYESELFDNDHQIQDL